MDYRKRRKWTAILLGYMAAVVIACGIVGRARFAGFPVVAAMAGGFVIMIVAYLDSDRRDPLERYTKRP